MEELRNMLKSRYPNIDFDNEKHLIDNGILDSAEVVTIIVELEEMFDISITMEYIRSDNFQSLESMWAMVEELQ